MFLGYKLKENPAVGIIIIINLFYFLLLELDGGSKNWLTLVAWGAKEGTLTMDDLTGGTFTISNGGVYGSMLSTPIINRPQSGILGMHNIQKRAVVVDDEIVIRPMMYLAFSYDHRIIDGKESVGFLLSIKNLLENPSKLILGV